MLTIKTERLVLRDLTADNWKLFYDLMQEPETKHYLSGYIKSDTEEEAKNWVKKMMDYNQENPRHSYNMAIEHNGVTIGWIGIGEADSEEQKDLDFGYGMKKDFWGKGFMTESLQAIFKFCFDNLPVNRITGECETSNLASQKVMLKSGMTLVKKFTKYDEDAGRTLEKLRFAIEKNSL